MENSTVQLTCSKFNEIYTNEEFRNQVAYAHKHCDIGGSFKFWGTCSYPVKYVVTEKQKEIAQKLIDEQKEKVFAENKNNLLFVGMGSTYKERYTDDVCNHRIRTEFKNRHGKQFFVEFGTGRGNELIIYFSIDRDREKEQEQKLSEVYEAMKKCVRYSPEWNKLMALRDQYQKQDYYNYKKLERETPNLPYTKTNILKIINEYFDCNFLKVIIDNYTISCNDMEVICQSPK